MDNFLSNAENYLPTLTMSLAIFVAFYIAAWVLSKALRRAANKVHGNKAQIVDLLAQIGRLTLIVFGLITALGTLGLDVSALVAGLGLTGFGISFALKDSISNAISGVLTILYQPFDVKDRIIVAGFEGEVKSIDLRYTTLVCEGKQMLVPNSTLFTNTVTVLR